MEISLKIVNSCRSCTARCCRGLAVVLTIPEAIRMVAETGLKAEDFLEFSTNIDSKLTPHYPLLVKRTDKSEAFVRAVGSALPSRAGRVEEFFIILRRRQKRDCVFLEEDLRCSVYNERPAVCRLYPFELDGKCVKKGALCPVKFMREEGTVGIASQLKRNLLEHGKIARKWHVKFGKGAPDMKKFAEYFSD